MFVDSYILYPLKVELKFDSRNKLFYDETVLILFQRFQKRFLVVRSFYITYMYTTLKQFKLKND